jgi:threonine synthase
MVGMWKAFEEIERLGWVSPGRRPPMVSVQAEGCAPIVRAFELGTEGATPWENPVTVADGLRVPRAIGDFLILRAVRESRGTAIAVSDEAMIDGMLDLGGTEGMCGHFRTHVSMIVSGLPPPWVTVSTVRVLPSADSVPLDVPNGLPPIFTTAL